MQQLSMLLHDQIEAMTMGDRIAIFDKGIIQQCDTPAIVYSKPNNMFVASFIGSPSIEFYKGRFDGEKLVVSDNLKIPLLKRPEGLNAYKDKDVVLGIRPEHIYTPDSSMSKVVEYSQEELLPVAVDVIEPMVMKNIVVFFLMENFLL